MKKITYSNKSKYSDNISQRILTDENINEIKDVVNSLSDSIQNLSVQHGIKGDKGDQGEKGQKGDKGDQGEKGQKGDKGDQGEKGQKGNKGQQGIQGQKGQKGDKGDPGEQGLTGQQGIQGQKGDKGQKGQKGDKGDKGDKGQQGIQGQKGQKGDKGEKGQKGDKGQQGIQGQKGQKGDPGVGNTINITIIKNVIAENWIDSNTYSEFPYQCTILNENIKEESDVDVVFSLEEALSGDYAPICLIENGAITIYSKVNKLITINKIRIL